MQELVFLKLGGSLITDKTQPYTVRLDKLADLCAQIARSLQTQPSLHLVLGHGSGSFGHTAAKEYKTREGVSPSPPTPPPSGEGSFPSPSGRGVRGEGGFWHGFVEVWYQASTLNRHVIQALYEAGVPAMTFSPAASVWSKNGRVAEWDLSKIKVALENGIVPVVHGDVVFDRAKGGTILSTEDLFEHLARELRPERILLAGLEEAVWADFPARRHRVQVLTRESFDEISSGVGEASGADVTGGMQSKVLQMLDLVEQIPGLQALIFSGEGNGNLERALKGDRIGTLIKK
ncbi:MAG: isopentenyl phosphate kinase family protein [Anaerolineales bacterium]|nr:isopentenyl phosphate kinase family protein [Anaerolineales bacterium]